MKTILRKLETAFAAAAFAEAGEHETARRLMSENQELRKTDRPSLRGSKRSAARPTLRVD